MGLLAALLPALPTGAVEAGKVTLSGGEKGQYFSDNTGNNVVTISVEDEDLSPPRGGKARYAEHDNTSVDFDLKLAVVGGEKQKVENKLRLRDATGSTATSWTFTLADTARDSDDNGVLNNHDVDVVVNGQTLDPNTNTGYRVVVSDPSSSVPGGGINQVMVFTQPRDTEGSVILTYEITEYEFGVSTPLRLAGTEIRYGTSLTSAANQINVSRADSTIAVVKTTDPPGADAGSAAVVTFVYHVKDRAKDYVSVSTTTSLATGVDRKLDGEETTAETNLINSKIAIVESSDFTQITNQAGNSANNADNAGKVQIGELNRTNMLGPALQTRLEGLATSEFGLNVTDDAEKLIPYLIPATHGDELTVTYADANPAASRAKTATIDLEAPEVTLVGPTHKSFTRSTVSTLRANVVDTGAGVEPGNIIIVANFVPGANTSRAPIDKGYSVTNVPNAVNEGKQMWAVTVVDRVGNTPVEDDPKTEKKNEGALGAAAPGTAIGAVDNPFVFTVDSSGPTMVSGKTGLYLKNPGITSGDKQETEAKNNREWVRVVFGLGDGTAPLDPESVAATDFTVDGATPLDAVVNAKKQDTQVVGSLVYLQVGEMDTNERPTVRLTGEVRDKAGNLRTDGTVTNIADGLAPVLTVTPSAKIDDRSVTITVTSSERLGLNPSVGRTTTKPVKGTPPSTTPIPVSLQTGALTTWTATYSNPAGDASRQYVVVSASDQAGNSDSVGIAANDKDLISFQVDDADPGLVFKDAEGNALGGDTKPQEGAVWIVAEFDDDEYTGDTYRKVTLTSVALKDGDGSVITSDTGDLFGGNDVACEDHEDSSATDKCATYTLAIDLAPGDYNIAATGTDTAGNSVSGNVDFSVTARKPFALDLKPGVNLISVPGSPVGDSGNLNILFEDQPVDVVTTFDRSMELAGENPWLRSTRDPETGLFTGDISTLQPGVAYFVTADARATVDITLRSVVGELPPTVMVRFGYNALGFSSISPTPTAQPIDDYLNSIPWTVAYSYDPTPGRGWEVIRPGSSDPDSAPDTINAEPGKGYLVFSRFDATLTP